MKLFLQNLTAIVFLCGGIYLIMNEHPMIGALIAFMSLFAVKLEIKNEYGS